jgi:hypothetical protein
LSSCWRKLCKFAGGSEAKGPRASFKALVKVYAVPFAGWVAKA